MNNATLAAAVERPGDNNAVTSLGPTWIGLGLSLFSMLVIRQVFRAVTPEPGTALALAREACMFAAAGALVWLVRRRERLPLRSIGIGTSPVWKSLAWGVAIAIACVVPAAGIAMFTGYGHGTASQAFAKLPLWVVFIVVVRAGVVEELFYRGYAIERLQTSGFGRIASWLIPLTIFAVGHWTGGAANILIALVLGGISPPSINGAAIWWPICSDTFWWTSWPTFYPRCFPEGQLFHRKALVHF